MCFKKDKSVYPINTLLPSNQHPSYHTTLKVVSLSPSTLLCIRIHSIKIILQPRLTELGHNSSKLRRYLILHSACSIQANHPSKLVFFLGREVVKDRVCGYRRVSSLNKVTLELVEVRAKEGD